MKIRYGFVSNSSTSSFVFSGLAINFDYKDMLKYISMDDIILNIEDMTGYTVEEYYEYIIEEEEEYIGTHEQKCLVIENLLEEYPADLWVNIVDGRVIFMDDDEKFYIGYEAPSNVKPEKITKFINKIKKEDPEFYKKCTFITKSWEVNS